MSIKRDSHCYEASKTASMWSHVSQFWKNVDVAIESSSCRATEGIRNQRAATVVSDWKLGFGAETWQATGLYHPAGSDSSDTHWPRLSAPSKAIRNQHAATVGHDWKLGLGAEK